MFKYHILFTQHLNLALIPLIFVNAIDYSLLHNILLRQLYFCNRRGFDTIIFR